MDRTDSDTEAVLSFRFCSISVATSTRGYLCICCPIKGSPAATCFFAFLLLSAFRVFFLFSFFLFPFFLPFSTFRFVLLLMLFVLPIHFSFGDHESPHVEHPIISGGRLKLFPKWQQFDTMEGTKCVITKNG